MYSFVLFSLIRLKLNCTKNLNITVFCQFLNISAFLVSELEASRMILVSRPEKKAQESSSPVFQELKGICVALGMSKPPANITMFQFFSGIEKKVSWFLELNTQKKQNIEHWPSHVFVLLTPIFLVFPFVWCPCGH